MKQIKASSRPQPALKTRRYFIAKRIRILGLAYMLVNAAKLLSQQAVTELHAYTGFHFSAPPYAIVAQDLPRKAGFSVVGHTISRSIGPGTSMSLFTKGLGIASTKLLSVQCRAPSNGVGTLSKSTFTK